MPKPRILVADDDPELLTAVVSALSFLGADVVQATTGAELLERLSDHMNFDLIVTDISMPWMTGLQVAHAARTAGLDTPILVMTGLDDDQNIPARVRALGPNAALLRKPFDLVGLERAVLQLLPAGLTAQQS